MKKIILSLIFMLIMTACKNPDEIAKEVAMKVKYYDDKPNRYTSDNEIEGYCSDYAVLFSLKTGANLVIQNQDKELNIPNGIYKITGKVSKELEKEIKTRFRGGRSGWIGPWPWLKQKDRWPLALYHPVTGIYKVELIEERTVITHFGIYMIGAKPHVWNELNGVIYDICAADMWDYQFTGIDTY